MKKQKPILTPWGIIENIRRQKGVSKKVLAQGLKMSYGYLVDLLNGRYPSKINNQKLGILAEILQVPIEELLSAITQPREVSHPLPAPSTPSAPTPAVSTPGILSILSFKSGEGMGTLTESGLISDRLETSLPALPNLGDPQAFGIKLHDDSMYPPYQSGSIFILRPSQSPQIGNLILAVTKDLRGWLGELSIHEKYLVVKPNNSSCAPVKISKEDITFIYPVVWVWLAP